MYICIIYICNVKHTAFFQEAKLCNNIIKLDTKNMKEFLKEKSDEDRKCKKSLLEIHRKKLRKKRR